MDNGYQGNVQTEEGSKDQTYMKEIISADSKEEINETICCSAIPEEEIKSLDQTLRKGIYTIPEPKEDLKEEKDDISTSNKRTSQHEEINPNVPQSESTNASEEDCHSTVSDDEKQDYEGREKDPIKLANFQLELTSKAKKGQNTIIYAPTGSGKFQVAIYIAWEFLHHQDEEGQKRKVVFLARTVPLVIRQFTACVHYLSPMFKIVGLTSSLGVAESVTEKDAADQILKLCSALDTTTVTTVETHVEELQSAIIKKRTKFTVRCMNALTDVLQLKAEGMNFRAVIFVRRRLICENLANCLNHDPDIPPDVQSLKAGIFCGTAGILYPV